MLVMPDIEEPFVPLGSDGLFVDPYESKSVITSLLQRIPTLFAEIKIPEPALLPTIDTALSALSATGGKIICSLSALPTWGPGRLFMRDEGKLHGIETEKKLFQTEHPGWKKTAGKMVECGVGIDFFIASASGGYMDLATIGEYGGSRCVERTKCRQQVMLRQQQAERCTFTPIMSTHETMRGYLKS